jgi:hypothetical protein
LGFVHEYAVHGGLGVEGGDFLVNVSGFGDGKVNGAFNADAGFDGGRFSVNFWFEDEDVLSELGEVVASLDEIGGFR